MHHNCDDLNGNIPIGSCLWTLASQLVALFRVWIIVVSPLIQFTSFAFCLWLRLWALTLPAPWCYASSSWCGTIAKKKKIHPSISFFWSWCFIHSNRKITNATIKLLRAKDGEPEQEELCLQHWGQKKRDRAFKCFKKSY